MDVNLNTISKLVGKEEKNTSGLGQAKFVWKAD